MSRLTVFDKRGYFIGDIRASTIRSWIKNANPNPGECRFIISRFDRKFSKHYLGFGNYILVRHSTLPDWIGIIVNRKFGNGFVEVKALQAEYILRKRNTAIIDIRGVAGSLFAQIIENTNNEPFNEKPIYLNNIYYANPERIQRIGSDALTLIQDIATRSKNDFDVTHSFDVNGRLYLSANWYQRKGIITGKSLREGYNIRVTDGLLDEDTRLTINYLEGRGDASTTGTRKKSIVFDETSISDIGLNQGSAVFNGNKEQVTIDTSAINLLLQSKDPFKTFDLTALNIDNTFQYLDIGNIHEVDVNTVGFETYQNESTQILGMEYDDSTDTCRLISEIYDVET